MDKRGFIRTLEAVIAIIVVFIFIYALSQYSAERADEKIDSIRSLQQEILRGISENEDYRKEVLGLTPDLLNIDLSDKERELFFVEYAEDNLGRFTPDNYFLVVCNAETGCGIPSNLPDENKIYTSAIIISGALEKSYSPKIVRLWVW